MMLRNRASIACQYSTSRAITKHGSGQSNRSLFSPCPDVTDVDLPTACSRRAGRSAGRRDIPPTGYRNLDLVRALVGVETGRIVESYSTPERNLLCRKPQHCKRPRTFPVGGLLRRSTGKLFGNHFPSKARALRHSVNVSRCLRPFDNNWICPALVESRAKNGGAELPRAHCNRLSSIRNAVGCAPTQSDCRQ